MKQLFRKGLFSLAAGVLMLTCWGQVSYAATDSSDSGTSESRTVTTSKVGVSDEITQASANTSTSYKDESNTWWPWWPWWPGHDGDHHHHDDNNGSPDTGTGASDTDDGSQPTNPGEVTDPTEPVTPTTPDDTGSDSTDTSNNQTDSKDSNNQSTNNVPTIEPTDPETPDNSGQEQGGTGTSDGSNQVEQTGDKENPVDVTKKENVQGNKPRQTTNNKTNGKQQTVSFEHGSQATNGVHSVGANTNSMLWTGETSNANLVNNISVVVQQANDQSINGQTDRVASNNQVSVKQPKLSRASGQTANNVEGLKSGVVITKNQPTDETSKTTSIQEQDQSVANSKVQKSGVMVESPNHDQQYTDSDEKNDVAELVPLIGATVAAASLIGIAAVFDPFKYLMK